MVDASGSEKTPLPQTEPDFSPIINALRIIEPDNKDYFDLLEKVITNRHLQPDSSTIDKINVPVYRQIGKEGEKIEITFEYSPTRRDRRTGTISPDTIEIACRTLPPPKKEEYGQPEEKWRLTLTSRQTLFSRTGRRVTNLNVKNPPGVMGHLKRICQFQTFTPTSPLLTLPDQPHSAA